MISFSIWHCDYCLGDICCCIKSNLPFLPSIVSTQELFSFSEVGGDILKKHPSLGGCSVFGTTCPPRPCWHTSQMDFALCKTSRLTDCPLWECGGEEGLTAVHAFACAGCGPSLCCSWGCQLFPFSWLAVSRCPCDTWSRESLEQPAAGSPLLLACAAETLLQNKICRSHPGGWKGLLQDDFIRAQTAALGYAFKGWSREVLISTGAEGSTQHLAKPASGK